MVLEIRSELFRSSGPLTGLLKKGKEFGCVSEQEEAFRAVKELLVSAPILACPDFSRPFVLQTDLARESARFFCRSPRKANGL